MIGTDVSNAADLLSNGQLVGIPTETVYGLAANASDDLAVASIYKLKNRPTFNPLILHVASVNEAKKYCTGLSPLELKLAERFWPGPLTLIVEKKNVSDLITAGLATVGIRVPNNAMTLDLLNRLDFPLVAPSANPSNAISPTSAKHVETMFGNNAPYVLDGGDCEVGIESTIVQCQNDQIVILREGTISQEMLAQFGTVRSSDSKTITSPGQQAKHYSPRKELIVVSDFNEIENLGGDKKISALLNQASDIPFHRSYYLSADSNLAEIASNLFSAMHQADADDSDLIVASWVENEGIGRAINDKLRRAQSNG